ncbi:MAG: alpha-E domain-containing protein [Acidimicrobiales bacterium]
MPSHTSPLLLSRVAESAYWAGRYLERAEGTARLIKAHADLIIDLPKSAGLGWGPLLALVGIDPTFVSHHPNATEDVVVHHLTADEANPSSVRSSIASVHRNLRVTRSVMPVEAAEVLIDLHNTVQDTADQAVDRRTRNEWLSMVMRGCQTLSGILTETMTHDDAYCFFSVGRRLERADLTARVLDVQSAVLTGRTPDQMVPYNELRWTAALRSVSALQSFRRSGASSTGEATVAFLLHDAKCPRTIESCLVESSRWLLEIPGHEEPMAACASISAMVQDIDVEQLIDGRLHDFSEALQESISMLHSRIEATWFAPDHAAVGS